MRIVLCGLMGSGKSSVGKLLAGKLNCAFYDLDEIIVKQTGSSIKEIFEEQGEASFRKLEDRYFKEIPPTGVVSLGGGALESVKGHLKSSDILIYLKSNPLALAKRLQGETQSRPLLAGKTIHQIVEVLDEMLKVRENSYQTATHTIDVNGKSLESISNEILKVAVHEC